MANDQLPPIKLAFILDGEVADVLHTDERLAAIFMSNPLIIDVTDKINNDEFSVQIKSTYNAETGEFTKPVPLEG